MEKKRIVVIGNGMVEHRLIDELSQKNSDGQFDIITFSEEPRLAYDRVQLSSFFSGKDGDDLMLTSENEYKEQGITYFLNEKVVSIQRESKCVVTNQGREIAYDNLILATGSYPFVPPIPGNEQAHCHVYRTIEDLEAIRASGDCSKVGVVIGGSLLGLEAANAIQNMGLETHVVEFAPRLMAVQLDEGGGELLKQKITALGVNVHTEKATQNITKGDTCRYKLTFADGTELETDMVVFSAGIRPQDELAKAHDLTLGERGGIVINNQCQTNDSDIYAIGECALWDGKIFGLVAPGYQMAKVAVASICGTEAEFKEADMSTKLKLLGVDVASIGDAQGSTPGAQSYTFSDGIEQVYKRIIVSEDGKTLLGAVLVGDVESYPNLLQTMLNGLPLPEFPSVLLLSNDAADSDAGSAGLATLPDEAQICSCYDVTKGCIKTAVASGCTTMADLKAETKASTGCGGCAALTKQVMDAELAALGHEVNNNLCEHFEYTRLELADIVRIKKIKTFDELLESHGKGLGCDVCKPTVGSILASFWNDYVLKNEHMGLQDTNDIYLGNMQKDGTYSVVPRVAGGEITPDKLIVLGQVAKDYNLYTKVTGGQRIDLFVAQLHELPEIWKILADAGFETGHAYGKSVRTVKSCVGSTWCRYGVDDSVGFAINIEDRYKGLRSPHKLKFAVSGCTRECAEAQSKDIGIIATENGWNLFVFGPNNRGQLGLGHEDTVDAPVEVTLPDDELAVYATSGSASAYVVTRSGKVYSAGDNGNLQLGRVDDKDADQNTFGLVDIPADEFVVSVAIRDHHVFALTAQVDVYSWGNNGRGGELGDGTVNADRSVPAKILEDKNIISVETGADFGLAVDAEGTVYGWGSNDYGALAQGTPVANSAGTLYKVEDITSLKAPEVLVNLLPENLGGDRIVEFQGGSRNAHALTLGGDVYSWGDMGSGYMGNGYEVDDLGIERQIAIQPVKNETLSEVNVLSLSSNTSSHFAVDDNGKVWAWGSAADGKLGVVEDYCAEVNADAYGEAASTSVCYTPVALSLVPTSTELE